MWPQIKNKLFSNYCRSICLRLCAKKPGLCNKRTYKIHVSSDFKQQRLGLVGIGSPGHQINESTGLTIENSHPELWRLPPWVRTKNPIPKLKMTTFCSNSQRLVVNWVWSVKHRHRRRLSQRSNALTSQRSTVSLEPPPHTFAKSSK